MPNRTTKQKITTWIGFGVCALLALGGTAGAVIVDKRGDQLAECTDKANVKIIAALNDRTSYTDDVAARQQQLWQAQYEFLQGLQTQDQAAAQAAYNRYVSALQKYNDAQASAAKSRKDSPYPTLDEVQRCRQGVIDSPLFN